jgi:hypothetical protein
MRIARLDGVNPTPISGFSLSANDAISTSGRPFQVLRALIIDVFAVADATPIASYTFGDLVVTSNVLASA